MDKVTLYIGTHNKTGLKYFGKTIKYNTASDLQKYYHGSGLNWNKHLKEFGDDVTMEVYGIYNLDEVKNKALTFSLVNDIVNSNEWANMILEDGLDAGGTTGYKHSQASKDKMSKSLKGRKHSEERKINISNGSKGKKLSDETKAKISDAMKGQIRNCPAKYKERTTKNKIMETVICPHCNKEGKGGNMKRYHFDNCKKLSKVFV